LLEVWPLLFSKSWLLTLQDVAPIIGVAVMVIIVAAIVLFGVWWYRYWIRKGIRDYEKQHGGVRLRL
jgi:hypothetical protein